MTPISPSREGVQVLFDNIAHRYDLVNKVLSFRQDIKWRRALVDKFPGIPGQKLLDLATGTADVPISACGLFGFPIDCYGIDISGEMLRHGRQKVKRNSLDHAIHLSTGNAMNIPFPDSCFDIVTISFGIRNVVNTKKAFSEVYRVLKNAGKFIILEFSLPENRVIRRTYLWYFRYILPAIGYAFTRDNYAYRYLNRTVETFPYGDALCASIRDSGFDNVSCTPYTRGVASIYTACKTGQTA